MIMALGSCPHRHVARSTARSWPGCAASDLSRRSTADEPAETRRCRLGPCPRPPDPTCPLRLRGAARRPGGRRRLHLAAQRTTSRPAHDESWRHGKQVVCEKSLSRDRGDGRRSLRPRRRPRDRSRPRGGHVRAITRQTRRGRRQSTSPLAPTACTWRWIRSHFSFLLEDRQATCASAEKLDGGALMDLGCYCVSASRLLDGSPESVAGVLVLGGDGAVDVSFAITLRRRRRRERRLRPASFGTDPGHGLRGRSAHDRPTSCSAIPSARPPRRQPGSR